MKTMLVGVKGLKHRRLVWCVVVVLAGALFSTSTGIAAKIELAIIGGHDGFSNEQDQAVWREKHPDVEFNLLGGGIEQALVMTAAGTPPDLMRVHSWDIPRLVHLGLVADISDYVARSEVIEESDLAPVHKLYEYDGGLYGLCKDWSADLMLWFNKALFDASGIPYLSQTVPITYDELMDLAQKLTVVDADGTTKQWGFNSGYTTLAFMGMLTGAEVQIYNDEGTEVVIANSPDAVRAARWWVEMKQRGWLGGAIHGSSADLASGRLAIAQVGYWYGGRTDIQAASDDLACAPAPLFGTKRVDHSVGTGFVVIEQSPHKDMAYEALEWLVAGQPARTRAQTGWGIPPLKSLMSLLPQDTPLDRMRLDVTMGQAPCLVPIEPNKYDPMWIDRVWSEVYTQAGNGEISPDEMVRQLQHMGNVRLQEAAGM